MKEANIYNMKIEVNDKFLEVGIIITNQKFIVLKDINKIDYKEAFL